MADQDDEWASPSGGGGASGERQHPVEPPRYGERVPGWTPPAPAEPGSQGGYAAPVASPVGTGYVPPPKPGLIPLHPLGFGQLLGASFAVLRYNPRATIVPTLLINIVQVAVSLALFGFIGISAIDRVQNATDADRGAILAGSIAEGALGGIVIAAISVFGTALLQGMLVLVVARGALGERPHAGETLRRALKSIWPLVGFAALVAAVQVVAILVLVLLVVGVVSAGGTVGLVFGILIGVFGGLGYLVAVGFLVVKLATVPSAIVLERLGVFAAIGRSWTLLRGAFWRTFGLFALLLVIIYFASQLVSVPFSFLGGAIGGLLFPDAGRSGDPATALTILLVTTVPAVILSTIVQGIGQIAQVSAFALTYLDRRIRREGLDLELQRVVEQGGPDPFEPAPR